MLIFSKPCKGVVMLFCLYKCICLECRFSFTGYERILWSLLYITAKVRELKDAGKGFKNKYGPRNSFSFFLPTRRVSRTAGEERMISRVLNLEPQGRPTRGGGPPADPALLCRFDEERASPPPRSTLIPDSAITYVDIHDRENILSECGERFLT